MRVSSRLAGKRSVCVFTVLNTPRWAGSTLALSYFRLGFEEPGLCVGLKFVCFTFSERELPFLPSSPLVFSRSWREHFAAHGKSHKQSFACMHRTSEVVWSAEAAYVNAERLSSVWVCIHQGNQASADGERSLQEQIRSTGSHTAITELLPIMGLRGAGRGGVEMVCVYSHTNMPICNLPSTLYGMCACMHVNSTPLW